MKTLAQEWSGATQAELTLRQRQILKLLRAGKVNKEIASELGIGVGTVKQHVVAIFKRLNVKNRAMAASSGAGMLQEEGGATLATDGLLERRPCVVLSMALPEEADASAVRHLHGTLASLAFDNDALFLARRGSAGDVIFGVQRATEYDLVKALRTALAAFKEMSALDSALAGELSAGLTAGLAVASMKRYGGWSGEAIASAAIFSARELIQSAGSGQIAFGQPARDLMSAFGIGDGQKILEILPFQELETLRWTGERFVFPLIDRSEELGLLAAALKEVQSKRGRLVYLEGETGMGKSRLCREIMESCVRKGGVSRLFRCQPLAAGESLSNVLEGGVCSVEGVAEMLCASPVQVPELVVVDDFHLLTKERQSLLFAAARTVENKKGRLIIFSGRRLADIEAEPAKVVHLGRLPVEAIEKLVRVVVRGCERKIRISGVRTISNLAAGVPLFAVELAKHYGANMLELPLLVTVCARLDSLALDRKMLRVVARYKGRPTLEEVAARLGGDAEALRPAVDRARASGVLSQDKDDRLSFSHPLLCQAINHLSME